MFFSCYDVVLKNGKNLKRELSFDYFKNSVAKING